MKSFIPGNILFVSCWSGELCRMAFQISVAKKMAFTPRQTLEVTLEVWLAEAKDLGRLGIKWGQQLVKVPEALSVIY